MSRFNDSIEAKTSDFLEFYSRIRSIELALNVSKLVRCSVGLLLVTFFDPVRFPRNSKRRMKEAIASPKQSHSAVRHNTDLVSRSTRNYAVTPRKKSRHFAMAPLLFPGNGVWGSSVEFPYWWRVATQIWVVFVIRWSELSTTQKHHWSTTQIWVVTRHQYGISALLPRSDIISRGN